MLRSTLSRPNGSHRWIAEFQRRQRHTLEHPQYPGLYYHPIQTSGDQGSSATAYSVSFLDSPAPNMKLSPTTIGILSHNINSRTSSSNNNNNNHSSSLPELIPRNFQENLEFKQVMHDILREAIKGDLTLDTLAKNRPEDGFM